MKIASYPLFLFSLFSLQVFAQDTITKVPSTFSIAINQDNAFGFYPAVHGSFELNDQVSLTYYGNFWTNPSYGTLVSGTDLWLEMGLGVSMAALEDRILINPSIGTTHGQLLSGSTQGEAFEGLVPSLTLFYLDDRFEGEVFASYYLALKNLGDSSGDYVLYWILPGVVLSPNISLGLHYESFVNTRISQGETSTLYQWFGGYFKFIVNDKYTFRFSAGTNVADNLIYSEQFYKLNVFIPLTD